MEFLRSFLRHHFLGKPVVVAKLLFSQATHYRYENHYNDHKVKQELIIQQILLISKQRIYIWQTDRRICMLLLRLNLQEKPCMEMKEV